MFVIFSFKCWSQYSLTIKLHIKDSIVLSNVLDKGEVIIYYDSSEKDVRYIHWDSSLTINCSGNELKNAKVVLNGRMLSTIKCGKFELQDFGYNDITLYPFKTSDSLHVYLNLTYPPKCDCKVEPCNAICPKCHSDKNAQPIFWGFPLIDETGQDPTIGYYLGGCEVTQCSPHWHCKLDNIDY